ncbi:MAG TPA: FtsK/SpoIIIE domain-containing protein [Streptosporangiaceae bacterium]|nr:FtsK/SpoIIIE domain-containing protein [Streptosporangiaceae bacterium]
MSGDYESGTGRELTVEDAAASVVRLANVAATLNAAYQETARHAAETARQHADRQHLKLRRQVLDMSASRSAAVVALVQTAAESLAPGVLTTPWDNVSTWEPAGILDAASYVRVGTVRPFAGGSDMPAAPLLLPLLDHGNILVSAPGGTATIGGIFQEIILRALLGTGAGQLTLSTFDPLLRGTTAPFTALRQVSDELVPPTLASPEELRGLLDELSRDIRRISELYEGVPTTLGEFRREARQPIERYRLILLLDYPTGFDDRTHGLLRTLMRTGPVCGISFVVHHDINMARSNEALADELYPLASVIRLGEPSTVDGFDGLAAETGNAPGLSIIEPAIDALRERAKDAAAPKISFSELHPKPSEYWQESSVERVAAIIGRCGHQPVEITIGDEREQRHNILVSGAVGQGKSNLLLVLIHSWAARYPPRELDLYLLDFKDGVTLYPLAPHPDQEGWLPHARVLGLESDRSYGAAVLQHLVDEFERRAEIIRPYGDNLTRYRKARPAAHMPRIIVIVDEFQVLFEEDDDLASGALLNLERLARKGRAYGIHLVLASQTLSGITAMLSKQDGIFAQFPIRLALKNSAGESRAVLDQHNSEAARLRYRGELIVNTDFGQVEANRRAVVALADPLELAALRVSLWRLSVSPVPPAVFNGGSAADLVDALHAGLPADDREPRALLGMPVAVASKPFGVPLSAESGRHMSVIGTGDNAATRQSAGAIVLQAAAVSLGYQHQPGMARFIILNLLAAGSGDQPAVSVLAEAMAALGHDADVRGAAQLIETLTQLSAELTERRSGAPPIPTYLVAFGMDRAPNLRIPDAATFTQPIDALHTIWREGSSLGVHVLGWWRTPRAYTDQLGFEASGTVEIIALLRISGQDVADLLGPFVSWTGPGNRALVRDVAEASEPMVVVPFAGLQRDDITRLTRQRTSL